MKKLNTAIHIDNKDWFKRWFNSSFYHKLYGHRDDREAADFVNLLLARLQPASGSHMLDLGCGTGRHSKVLASNGFDVTGLDIACSSINQARKFQTTSLRFLLHDMRESFGNNCFDYVFSFFTSFGYFQTKEEDNAVIANIAASLRSGGQLILDYINSPVAEEKLVEQEACEIDGIIYHIARWTDKEYLFKKIEIDDPLFGDLRAHVEQVRKISIGEFESMLENHGLQLEVVYGNYSLERFDESTSPRLILLARKTR